MKNRVRVVLASVLSALVGPMTVQAQSDSKLYLNGNGGVSLIQETTVKSFLGVPLPSVISGVSIPGIKAKFDPGVRLDLAGGYRFIESFAAELEVGCTWNGVRSIGGVPISSLGGSKLDLWQIPVMANIVIEPKLHPKWKPYYGAGIGGVYQRLEATLFGTSGSGDTFVFGYQAMAGVRYEVNDRVSLGIGYKFMGTTGQRNTIFTSGPVLSHSFFAVVMFKF